MFYDCVTFQKILQRHVNSHFSNEPNNANGVSKTASKKSSADQSESTKNLKRAGVKLKYRKTVFSARIFDFFEPAVMEAVKHKMYQLDNPKLKQEDGGRLGISGSLLMARNSQDEIEFRSRILMLRREVDGSRKAWVRWEPENW